mgnify:CR=1 FL=1
MQRIVLAMPLGDISETVARRLVLRVPGEGYKNYLTPISGCRTKSTAIDSLITALQVLYKQNGYSAKYIVVARG